MQWKAKSINKNYGFFHKKNFVIFFRKRKKKKKLKYSCMAITRNFGALDFAWGWFQVPHRFRWVIENTLKEFYKSIMAGKDLDPSWKKQIYKVIARLDDFVPEYFKSQAFLEQLE